MIINVKIVCMTMCLVGCMMIVVANGQDQIDFEPYSIEIEASPVQMDQKLQTQSEELYLPSNRLSNEQNSRPRSSLLKSILLKSRNKKHQEQQKLVNQLLKQLELNDELNRVGQYMQKRGHIWRK